jgi:pimeloyl-ACP methyl ester carboxylesterase
VHWVDHGGPERPDSLIVCVHGLGGGTVNWDGLAPLLTDRHRLVALDLPGSGLTDPGERNADLDANAELLGAFVDEVAAGSPGARVVLVGNSMGAVLSAMVLGARPDLADALVLLAPAVPGPGRVPGPMLLGGLGLYGVPVAGAGCAPPSSWSTTPCGCAAPTPPGCTRSWSPGTWSWLAYGWSGPSWTVRSSRPPGP